MNKEKTEENIWTVTSNNQYYRYDGVFPIKQSNHGH